MEGNWGWEGIVKIICGLKNSCVIEDVLFVCVCVRVCVCVVLGTIQLDIASFLCYSLEIYKLVSSYKHSS